MIGKSYYMTQKICIKLKKEKIAQSIEICSLSKAEENHMQL